MYLKEQMQFLQSELPTRQRRDHQVLQAVRQLEE